MEAVTIQCSVITLPGKQKLLSTKKGPPTHNLSLQYEHLLKGAMMLL